MAAECVTPTDPMTGLPHLVLPYEPQPGLVFTRIDYHHHFSPRRHPEIFVDTSGSKDSAPEPESLTLEQLGALATRMCRGQMLPREIHERSHSKYIGPELPTTLDAKFDTVVKALAGLVSRWAIDLRSPKDDQLVYMDDDVFERVTNRQVLCTERALYDRPADYRRRVFADFLLRYAITQDLSHVSSRTVDQFLNARTDEERRIFGNQILVKGAFDAGIDRIKPIHRELQQQGQIQPGSLDLRSRVKKYIYPERLERYYPLLVEKLAS